MGISVNSILDAGLLVHGKLPDIYWDMGLSGSEMKVLRYVYNHCIRLYKNLKFFPKGHDGSPRFWRGKERMADDCSLSYPTFRKCVRHLFELGLVTSMDGEEDAEELYCIGLSATFLSNLTLNKTVKNFRLHSLKDLILIIYDSNTVEILNINLQKLPSITNVIEPVSPQEIVHSSGSLENSQTQKSTKKVKRIPIKVGREPIMLLPESVRLQNAKKKLTLLKNVRTPYEREILKIAEYYEYKCRRAIHSTGFKALGKDFRNHKNWKFLVRIHDFCIEKGWDYKIYIDAQFDRVKYWTRPQKYPYLNQFNSENAIKYYLNYVKDIQEKTTITGDGEVKSEKVKSVNQQIIDDVIKDCESISEYIEKAKKRRVNKDLTPEQLKVLYLSDHWMGLSTSYLVSIPWFLMYINQFPEESFVTNIKEDIQTIQKSRKLYETTVNIVEEVEKQMGIPETLYL